MKSQLNGDLTPFYNDSKGAEAPYLPGPHVNARPNRFRTTSAITTHHNIDLEAEERYTSAGMGHVTPYTNILHLIVDAYLYI